MRITVLGTGSWGGTIAQHLTGLGHSLTAWSKFPEEIQELKTTRTHPLVTGLIFSDSIRFTTNLREATKNAEVIVIAVPSHIVRSLMETLVGVEMNNLLYVNLAKGIENDSLMTMSQVIREAGRIPPDRIVSVYGPSHAEEVAKRMPTTVVSACLSLDTAVSVQNIFSSDVLRVYTNTDILGVELGGSLKNVIAIAAGIIDGIGFGDNTKAALLTRAMTEMTRLGVKMGAEEKTFSGLSGIGDLIVTCLSQHSRNRYVGEEIGRGRKLDDILADMKMVAEGVKSAKSVCQLRKKYDVSMPISSAVYEVLFDGKDPKQAVTELMTRDLIKEH
ncbi:MAG: NAD(P)-dependent glycerol-3-phosphate dehydrogenase [Candidatus Marinimicrobia bacterium]|nr:NAD(P)-dependent glycerol-3-phosphate dehydrogenase [Candidatus Neomarinimicrobiota bacterium]